MKNEAAFFNAALWKMSYNERIFSNSSSIAELFKASMHEVRHVEQNFLAARYYAGQSPDKSVIDVARELHIPIPIAMLAVAVKFNANTPEKLKAFGKRMYDSLVINNKEYQKIVDDLNLAGLTLESAKIEANKAGKALKAKRTDAAVDDNKKAIKNLQAADAKYRLCYELYANFPHERDAHEVGDTAGLAFMGFLRE
jgi:hypothetical protein